MQDLEFLPARVTRAAKADPKKASVLAVIVVALAILWARTMGGAAPTPAANAGIIK